MGAKIAKDKPRRASTSQKRAARRNRYLDKVQNKDYDSFNTDDLIEFFADCYRVSYGHRWIHEQKTLCNLVFGQLLGWYGPRGALNFIAATFQHRSPPRTVKWYNSGHVRSMHDQRYFDHCLENARTLLTKWRELHHGEDT